ncbi:MAG: ScyD/ScyE family protein [Anaerolineae bacterium]|nr:ScyD/ScyE family protein [Anaerolineae bacterium]
MKPIADFQPEEEGGIAAKNSNETLLVTHFVTIPERLAAIINALYRLMWPLGCIAMFTVQEDTSMKRVRLTFTISLTLVLVLLLSSAPGAFANPTGPTAVSNDPFERAASYLKTHDVPESALQVPAGMQVIGTGLNNGRDIIVGPDGGLYIAENGSGNPANCEEIFPDFEACVGDTGSVTRIENGVQERIATGLPSWGDSSGFGTSGPAGITWSPREGFYLTIGLGFGLSPDDLAAIDPVGQWFGSVARMNPNGYWNIQADIYDYEATQNPDDGEVDSNPYGLVTIQGRTRVVADAGGNDLLKVNNNGVVSTLTVFPDTLVPAPPFLGLPPGAMIPMQAVPTSVTPGPDNTLYAGQLTGFPFPVGGANVFQVWPNGYTQVKASGFSAIVDITTGPDGSLYVLEFAHDQLACETMGVCDGRLTKVDAGGGKTLLANNLPYPGGVAVANDGTIYLTLFSIFPDFAGGGQVVRLN